MGADPMASVDRGAVSTMIDALRREAELSLHKVQATLGTVDGKTAIARVVQGYYNLIGATGSKLVKAHVALTYARAKMPSPQTEVLFQTSVKLLAWWSALAQGFTMYVREATPDERKRVDQFGIAPAAAAVVVAVAGTVAVIAVSVTGCAWAIVHYRQAATLAKEVDLLAENPYVADALAKINAGGGKGPGGNNDNDDLSLGTVLAVGGAVAAAAGAVWWFNRKKA